MWRLLLGGVLGFGIAKILEPEKKDLKKAKDEDYSAFYVYVQVDDDGGSEGYVKEFFEFQKAYDYYSKLKKDKKVKGVEYSYSDYTKEVLYSGIKSNHEDFTEKEVEKEYKEFADSYKGKTLPIIALSLAKDEEELNEWKNPSKDYK